MGRTVYLTVFIFMFSFAFVSTGQCWPWSKKAVETPKQQAAEQASVIPRTPAPQETQGEPGAPSAPETRPAPQPSKAQLDKMRALRDKKRSGLNNTQWEIELIALSGKGPKQKDNLVFQDNKFFSEEFARQSFLPSNYTLTLLENDVTVVETMQSSDKGGLIFWRIEIDPALASFKGVLSRQLPNNKTEDFSFSSIAKGPVQINILALTAPAPKESDSAPSPESK